MNNVEYLVDKNIVIDFLYGKTELFNLFDDVSKIGISIVSVAEIYAFSKTLQDNGRSFSLCKDFCSTLEQFSVTEELLDTFSDLKNRCEDKGVHLSNNQLWVASTAVYYKLTLISDDSNYDCFDELKRKKY